MRMKYVVVLCDGMADEPLEELGGMTPLEKAHTPNLTAWRRFQRLAWCRLFPTGWLREVIRRIFL